MSFFFFFLFLPYTRIGNQHGGYRIEFTEPQPNTTHTPVRTQYTYTDTHIRNNTPQQHIYAQRQQQNNMQHKTTQRTTEHTPDTDRTQNKTQNNTLVHTLFTYIVLILLFKSIYQKTL